MRTPTPDEDALDEIVREVYAAALDPSLWPAVLDRVSRALGALTSDFHFHEWTPERTINLVPWGWPREALESYAERFVAADPWAAAMPGMPAGALVSTREVVPDQDLRKTALFNEWLRVYEIDDGFIGYIDRDGGEAGVAVALFVHDPERAAATDEDLVRRIFGLTPSEARVAVRLAGGLSPKEVAALLGTSTHTARNHLRQVYRKAGVDGQAGLVRVLMAAHPRIVQGDAGGWAVDPARGEMPRPWDALVEAFVKLEFALRGAMWRPGTVTANASPTIAAQVQESVAREAARLRETLAAARAAYAVEAEVETLEKSAPALRKQDIFDPIPYIATLEDDRLDLAVALYAAAIETAERRREGADVKDRRSS